MEIKPLKVRAWKLESGEFLVLLFMRTADDRLELLTEEYVPDKEALEQFIRQASGRLEATMRAAGIPASSVRVEFAGAKKA